MPFKPDRSEQRSEPPQRGPVSSKAVKERRLLDVVVHETVSALDDLTRIRTVDWPRLCEVAKRYSQVELTLDPILIELVSVLLEIHLPRIGQSFALRTRLARSVSETLFDNPVCRGRLELLWSQLLDDVE